jgi:hypothetical protein
VFGSVLVVALTVLIVVVAATVILGVGSTPEPTPTAALDLSVEGNTIEITHTSGETLDVRRLSMQISVDDEPLEEQPPVPFFSAPGFAPGPTGPFNSASDPKWEVGQTASLTVAATNRPTIGSGSTVSVRIDTEGMGVLKATTQL